VSVVTLPSRSLLESDGFRRMLAYSAAGHVLGAFALTLGALPYSAPDLPPPVFIEVVADPSPPPPARQRVKQPVVIPKQSKPKAKPKPVPRPKAKPAPKPEPKRPSASELLAQLRRNVEAREPSKTQETQQVRATAGARGRFDPMLAVYRRKVIALLRSNFSGARAFSSDPQLRARYEVQIDPVGGLRGVILVSSSGNRFFDESAERAIHKSPFPAPPRGEMTLDITFQPGSVF
jgi:TonB family protein